MYTDLVMHHTNIFISNVLLETKFKKIEKKNNDNMYVHKTKLAKKYFLTVFIA